MIPLNTLWCTEEKRLAWKYLDCSNLRNEVDRPVDWPRFRQHLLETPYPENMDAVFEILNRLSTKSASSYDEEARSCLMGVPAAFFYLTRFTLDTMERDEAGRPADPEVVKKAVCQDVVEEAGDGCRPFEPMAENNYIEGRLLDGFLLLAAGGSNTPDEVITVNLSSLQIVDIAEEDLAFFAQLHRVDLSDNQLGYEHLLEQIARIPRLGTLNLACNSISSLQVGHGILQFLEVLDLSFNGLHGDVLGQLARLPNLVWLNLASNCISSLPPEEELSGLQVLQELILDSNDLVQFMQWRSLDAVPQLRSLGAQGFDPTPWPD
eukprot:g27646.t1